MSQHRFHETHGNDIMIYHDWIRARRTETKDNGIVFTSTPIKPNEKITLKLIEVSDKLPGIISIGFTNHDPSTLQYDLPKSTKSQLKRKPGFWIGSLSKQLCTKDKVLFFYVSSSGTMHFGADGEEKGHLVKKIDTGGKLWGLVDIWSPTTTIQLGTGGSDSSKSLMLHQFKSRNVKLKDGAVCKHYKRRRMSYVFTSKPLNLNEKVLVKILDGGSLSLGVTSCDPGGLKHKHLPHNPDLLLDRPEYWMVINDPTWDFQKNDEVSYVITGSGEMKIWKNSALLLKVVHVDQTLKLWGFFGLGTSKEVILQISSTVDIPVVVPSAPSLRAIEPSGPIQSTVSTPIPSTGKTNVKKEKSTESTEAKKQNVGENSECVICCENVAEAALYPCGHMCMCFTCAKKQWRNGGDGYCPICRARIRDILRVYKV